ncbi:hypothetical protein AAFN75_05770 [Algibacter sp. AS12]|uniref:hypothetical protein n=1 Tax=Algibacter sp. AS12 TaxID=3135773 RepID=UPI00398B2D7D
MRHLYFLLTFAFLHNYSCFSQEGVLNFKVNQESKQIKKRTYSFSNAVNNDLAILVRERKNSFAFLFDENFQVKSKFDFVYKKKSKYNVVLGETILGSQYSLLYSNSIKNRFCVFTVDFDSKSIILKELKIDFQNDRYLKTISHKNILYVLSTSKKDDEIIIRKLNADYEFEIIKSHTLKLEKNQKLYTQDFLSIGFWATIEPNVVKIDNRIPNAIEQVSKENKIYVQNDNLYLTFDNSTEFTVVYSIDLVNFSIEKKKYNYPKGKIDEFKKFNSYFFDNKLFQIASSNKEMIFEVKSLENEVLKSYYFNKETPIDIKNSPIIQDGNTALPFVTKREFEEASKFLRKISSGNLGVSVYKKDDAYHFTIGGVKDVSYSTGAPMIMSGPTPITINNQVHYMPSPNPVFSSYQSYAGTKSTYFNTKLDLDFNYLKGEVDDNVFEKIKNYSESLKHMSGEDVFFHKDQLLFSYFDMKNAEFNLVKF